MADASSPRLSSGRLPREGGSCGSHREHHPRPDHQGARQGLDNWSTLRFWGAAHAPRPRPFQKLTKIDAFDIVARTFMLKIRLKRVGRKHDPSYRVVVCEHTASPKQGDSVDVIGSYDARIDRKDIDTDKAKHWLSLGAQPSGTVHNLFVDLGIISGKKINVLPKRKPVEEKPEEKAAPAPAPASETPVTEEAPAETAPEAPAETEAKKEETPADSPAEAEVPTEEKAE